MRERRGRPRETLSEPLTGWRAWTLLGSRDGTEVLLHPISGNGKAWPRGIPLVAGCAKHRLHRVPGEGCTCGIHAVVEADLLRRTRDPAVLGTIAAWGRVVEHARGFRAELAYPQRLGLVCRHCLWRRGAAGAMACDVVVRHRGGSMVPLCLGHLDLARRAGYPARRVLDAAQVEQVLLDAYSVDLLRILRAARRPLPAADPVG